MNGGTMESLGFEGFRFASPEFAPLLWLALLGVAFLVWRERRSDDALDALIAPNLKASLLRHASFARRCMQIAMLGLACAAFVLALMRPQWGARQIAATRAGAELMIALDVSRSMLAEDVAPSRLERAKAEILDLLAYLEGDQVGLIAFAGRASVLSPLTPDFGFLRLALENAGPHSVTRGGTRLEEPIRRAVAGFGPPGPAQRAILLITDGEDHDSFAKDAAEEAAEAGISIIAIGFGDEAGSPIVVTDPRTGARQPVLDADGVPVQSRLDGETLRELALITDGAYIPAGTGVLDLESIHRAHLERLMRGESDRGGRIVRDEGYPWCVLVGLLCLAASVLIGARRADAAAPARATTARAGGQRAGGLVATIALGGAIAAAIPAFVPRIASAQGDAPPALAAPDASTSIDDSSAAETEDARTAREIYNQGVRSLSAGEAADALDHFVEARRRGAGDPELRFHSTYNLGNASVAQAEAMEGEDPQGALAKLRQAADWFRQAVQLRSDDEDARHNLEIALRKALVLEDMLARRDPKDLDAELAALGDAQRALTAEIGGLVQRIASVVDPTRQARIAENLRSAFRDSATREREIASDAEVLSSRTRSEHDALLATPEEERTPEDALRSAQLGGVLHYLHRASERLGHTRRELRRQRAEAAYRRASAAIREIERARDQLREPDAALDALARELSALRSRSTALAVSQSALDSSALATEEADEADADGARKTRPSVLPAWITPAGLAEEQHSLATRNGELDLRLRAGLERAQSAEGGQALPPEAAAQLALIAEAEPFVAEAEREQREAAEQLDAGDAGRAVEGQTRALKALARAREFFLQLEGLIDLAYQDQERIRTVLTEPPSPEVLRESRGALHEVQTRNLERGERIEHEIERQLEQARSAKANPPPAAQGAPPVDPQAIAERERLLTAASQLMTQVFAGMNRAANRSRAIRRRPSTRPPGVRGERHERCNRFAGSSSPPPSACASWRASRRASATPPAMRSSSVHRAQPPIRMPIRLPRPKPRATRRRDSGRCFPNKRDSPNARASSRTRSSNNPRPPHRARLPQAIRTPAPTGPDARHTAAGRRARAERLGLDVGRARGPGRRTAARRGRTRRPGRSHRVAARSPGAAPTAAERGRREPGRRRERRRAAAGR